MESNRANKSPGLNPSFTNLVTVSKSLKLQRQEEFLFKNLSYIVYKDTEGSNKLISKNILDVFAQITFNI